MDWKTCLIDLQGINRNSICLFLGAGTSVNSGLKTWDELVDPYRTELELNDANNIPAERVFQYIFGNRNAQYNRFKNQLKAENEKVKPTNFHHLLARLNLPRVWTTNYDGLIEKAYIDEDIKYQVVAKDEDIYSLDYENNQIIKMHGSLTIEKETDIVLTESEYENYVQNRSAIYQLLQTDIRTKNMIYLGFSFNDINLRRIISAVWSQETAGKQSYLFMVPPKKSTNKYIIYERFKEDLERYNLIIVELRDYSEINDFLLSLVSTFYGKNIVFLGKRSDEKWNSLANKIGYQLASKGYKIHSGGGPNLSIELAKGAYTYLVNNGLSIYDKVFFYYRYHGGSTNPQKGSVLYCGEDYQEVRRKLISTDKICIVMGEDGENETGIKEEISIAQRKNCKIIPIGCSGKTAHDLWQIEKRLYNSNSSYSVMKNAYELINLSTADEDKIASAVVELAEFLFSQGSKVYE